MMNSQVYEVCRNRFDTTSTVRLLGATSILVIAVAVLCGCTQQSDGSVFKVQSGEKTLLDIKKNPDEKVSIEVDVPKVNLKMNDTTVEQRTTVTETTVNPSPAPVVPVQSAPSPRPVQSAPAPQPVPGVPGN